MNPARCRSDRRRNVFEKSNNVVIGPLLDLQDFRNRKPRALANLSSVIFRNLAKLCHRLAGENLNIQPNLKFALVRPDFAHLWPGITIDHSRNIKAACLREKRFVDHTKHLRTGRAIGALSSAHPVPGATTLSPLTQSDSTALQEK